jgi:hypothetical protein
VPQADTYTFTGLGPLGYPSYVDIATEQMLIAETGGTYGIRAVEPDLFAVPPPDGRWTAPAPPTETAAKPAVTVPASSEKAGA